MRATSKKKKLEPRSVCLHCGRRLKWYDNIPIVSWLFLKGKCRKCHKFIGFAEIYAEMGVALAWMGLGFAFVFAGDYSGLSWGLFIANLILALPLFLLAIYDGLYKELPVFALIISIILAAVVLGLKEVKWAESGVFSVSFILNPVFSVLILGGLYLFLYLISRGKWVGDGDWLIGVALGLALASPWLALITLFLSNFLATIAYFIPFYKNKRKQIPFGPFLVIAFVIVKIFEIQIMSMINI